MKQKKRGIYTQISLLMMIGIFTAGVITNFSQRKVSENAVRTTTGNSAEAAALEMISAIKEYPAYQWLLEYWYANADRIDVEYDADFGSGTLTEQKQMQFSARHPELSLHYLSQDEIEAMSVQDQKLYAEIAYSWL